MKTIEKLAAGLAAVLLLASFNAFPAPSGAPMTGNYHFLLEVEGVTVGQFASVAGLSAEVEVVEYRDGGDPGAIRKIPGVARYGDITLKRGYTASDDLWSWIKGVIDRDYVRKNGAISVVSSNGSEVARFNFFNAWPSRYALGLEGADGNDVAIESLTLTVERIDLD